MDLPKTPGKDSGEDLVPVSREPINRPDPAKGPKEKEIETSPASSGGGTGKSGIVGSGTGGGDPNNPGASPGGNGFPVVSVLLMMRLVIRGPERGTDPRGNAALSGWLSAAGRWFRQRIVSWVPHEAGILDAFDVVTRFPAKFVNRLVLTDILSELRWRLVDQPLAAGQTFLGLAKYLAGVHADRIDVLRCLDPKARSLAVCHLSGSGWAVAVCQTAARAVWPNASEKQQNELAAHGYNNALEYLDGHPLPDDMTVNEFLTWQTRGNRHGGNSGGGRGGPKIPGPQPRPFSKKIQEADEARQARVADREQQAFRDRMDQIKRTSEKTARSERAVAAVLSAGENLALGGYESSPDDEFDGSVYNWIIARYQLIRAIATEKRLSNDTVAVLQAHVVWATGEMAERRELSRAAYSCRSRTLGAAIRVGVTAGVRETVVRAVYDLYAQSLGSQLPGFAATIAADLTRGGTFGQVSDARVSESLRRIRWRVRRSFDESGPGGAFGLGFGDDSEDVSDLNE